MTLYYVGIDGGGTSCRARIRDELGTLIGEANSGSANILLGTQLAMNSIHTAISNAAKQGNLTENDYKNMHVGLALAGAEQRSAWNELMFIPHPFASVTLNTDAYGACIGAHAGKNGAIMISGTGSCGIYLKNHKQHVVGGREFPISDLGSGAMMGLDLIQQTLLAYDEIHPHTELSQHVFHYFEQDVDNIVTWSKTAKPKDYAQFAPLIFELADKGDELAVALLKKTANDIEMYLMALNRKGANKIALMGGIAQRIENWLSPHVQQWIVKPQFDAIEGAIMFAGKPVHNLYTVEDSKALR